jgi:hypothetical protein
MVVFVTVNILPSSSLSLSTASGVITPLVHVSLSRREISVLYAALLLDIVILASFCSVFGM